MSKAHAGLTMDLIPDENGGIFVLSDRFMNKLKHNFSPLEIAVIIAVLYFNSAKPGRPVALLTGDIAHYVNEDRLKVSRAIRHLLASKVVRETPAFGAKNSKSISINHNYNEWISIRKSAAHNPGEAPRTK